MRSSRFSSAMIGFVIGCLAIGGRWAESILDHSYRTAYAIKRTIDVMGEFPASAKVRFEAAMIQWRWMSGAGEGLSADGLVKSSHHFMQRGVQNLVIGNTHALA